MGLPQGPSVRATTSEGAAGDAGESPGNTSQLLQLTHVSRSSHVCVSRAHRIETRDNPGGETKSFAEAAFGVDGTVPSEVIPRRHCRPTPVTESRAWRIAEALVTESRAWRIADRDIPGGERNGERSDIVEPAAGVPGIVSSGVIPKRHRLPTLVEVTHSAPDELSSPPEALPQPTSVVSESSCNVDGFKAALAMGSAVTWATEASIWVAMMEVAILESVGVKLVRMQPQLL